MFWFIEKILSWLNKPLTEQEIQKLLEKEKNKHK